MAEGLEYLHGEGVIHSVIKADNVLISKTGEPRICDFGISRVLVASQTLASSTDGSLRGSVRWMAIELFMINGPPPVHTTYTDIWAFGMTVHVSPSDLVVVPLLIENIIRSYSRESYHMHILKMMCK